MHRDELIARILAVDLARPEVDKVRVEGALVEHLYRLGLDPLPVWWGTGVASAAAGCTVARDSRDWFRACARVRVAAMACGWRPIHARLPRWLNIPGTPVGGVLLLWESATKAVLGQGPGDPRPLHPNDLLPPYPVAPWLQYAIEWADAPPRVRDEDAVVRWTEACRALVDAYEAGLGFFWMLVDEIVAVPRPALSLVAGGTLPNWTDPVIEWPNERYWFWHGIHVPQRFEEPERITVLDIQVERNVELRRVLLERMGYERYVRESGAELVSKDAYGRLWTCTPLPGEREPLVFVEVENATRNPDGSRRRYFLRVPPSMRTARAAVAWTFDVPERTYAPEVES